jgi:hypothetical protein
MHLLLNNFNLSCVSDQPEMYLFVLHFCLVVFVVVRPSLVFLPRSLQKSPIHWFYFLLERSRCTALEPVWFTLS